MERKMSKTAIIVLSVLCVLMLVAITVLGVYLGIYISKNNKAENSIESVYEQSYYTLLDSVLNMENNLSKLRIVRSLGLQSQLLKNTCVNSETAVSCLSNMSYSGYSMQNLIKFCNQTGDYCNYLFEKSLSNEDISDSEYEMIDKLYNTAYQLGVKLSSIKENIINDGYRFVGMIGQTDDVFSGIINELSSDNFEYPSLIYDGPFSDSIVEREIKGLDGDEITNEEGLEIAKSLLGNRKIKEINFTSEYSVRFDVYAYTAKLQDDIDCYIEISKKGGLPVMLDCYETISTPDLSQAQGIDIAEKYCKRIGFENMKGVWACVSSSVLYVNLCYEDNGVICYPDMIKVKVSLETGHVLGLESTSYIINHDKKREIDKPTITQEEAKKSKYGPMKVESVRLALIPKGESGEKLTYEVYGKIDSTEFFVYVDAKTGNQVKIFQVIDSDEGRLLL